MVHDDSPTVVPMYMCSELLQTTTISTVYVLNSNYDCKFFMYVRMLVIVVRNNAL